MESCKWHDECPRMRDDITYINKDIDHINKDIESIKKSDVLQEASLKSIHLRLDKADIQRQEQTSSITELVTNLTAHMQWEEKKAELDREHLEQEQKKKEDRFKIYAVIFSIIFGVSAWFSSYVFNSIQDNVINIERLNTYKDNNDKHTKKVDETLDEMTKILYKIVKE